MKIKKIEKIKLALHNEGTFYKENIDAYITELQFKVNEIIDRLNTLPASQGESERKK